MMARRPVREMSRRQAGYALLMLVFLSALLLLAAAAATPRLLTQGLREREDELIWRGEQYARAVRLHYRKLGRFPQSLEELTEAKSGVRFLRRAYADPVNRVDGSWRLIYVAPSGQLIGSVKRQSLLQFPGAAAAGVGQGSSQPFPSAGAQKPPPQPVPAPVTTSPPEGMPPEILPEETEQGPPPARVTRPAPMPQPGPGTATSGGTAVEGKVFGGNIIGVASKVKRSSLRVYDGATTYFEWEFIWDPTKDAVGVGQPVVPAGPLPKGVLGDTPPQPPPRPR